MLLPTSFLVDSVRVHACVCVRAFVRVLVCVYMRVCMRMCVRACVCTCVGGKKANSQTWEFFLLVSFYAG